MENLDLWSLYHRLFMSAIKREFKRISKRNRQSKGDYQTTTARKRTMKLLIKLLFILYLPYQYFDILRSIQSALILIKYPILSTLVSFMNIGVFFQFIPGCERSLPRLFRQKELIPPAKLTFILSCSLIFNVRPLCISIKHTRIHAILLLWLSIKIIESLSPSSGFMFFP